MQDPISAAAAIVDPVSAASLVDRWGAWGVVVFMALTAVVTVVTGQWVPGYIYRKLEAECESLRATSAQAVDTAEQASANLASALRTIDQMQPRARR